MAKPSTIQKTKLTLTIAQMEEMFAGLNEIANLRTLPLRFAVAAGMNARKLHNALNGAAESFPKNAKAEELQKIKTDPAFAQEFEFHPMDYRDLKENSQVTPAFIAICADLINNLPA